MKGNNWLSKIGYRPVHSLKRINRKNYFLGLVFFIGAIIFPGILMGVIGEPDSPTTLKGILYFTCGAITIAALFVSIFSVIRLHIRRFHDLGRNGWTTLFLFLPYINLLFYAWLLLAKGEEGGNKYGEPVAKDAKFFDVIFSRNIPTNM